MTVAAFHSTRSTHTTSFRPPLALPGLRRVRWSLVGGLAANAVLWAAIFGGISLILH